MISPDTIEAFIERAAIIEYESGVFVSRDEAERIAAEHLRLTPDELAECRRLSRMTE